MRVLMIIGSIALANAMGGCDNECSNHGKCVEQGRCECYPNFGIGEDAAFLPGDCSSRVCEYSPAWSDGPSDTGLRHKYSECGGKGICNRETGECQCVDGYEGSSCQRSSCPNDCSGNGRCQYIEEFGFGSGTNDNVGAFADIMEQGYQTVFDHYGWDKGKTRGCLCDPEFSDVDCSKRICPYGNDPGANRKNMAADANVQVQKIYFRSYDDKNDYNSGADKFLGRTFALIFKTKLNETYATGPINYLKPRTTTNNVGYAGDCRDMTLDIQTQLQSFPGRPIDEVKVACDCEAEVSQMNDAFFFTSCNVSFTGDRVQGQQNLLMVLTEECLEGCTPQITGLDLKVDILQVSEIQSSDANSWECSNRGKCDYDTGICHCYDGYYGHNCNNNHKLV